MSAQPPALDPVLLARLRDVADLINRVRDLCNGKPHEVVADALLSLYVHTVLQCPGCCAGAAQALPTIAAQLAEQAARADGATSKTLH